MDRHSHSIVEVVSYRIDDAAKPLSCSDREALQLGDDDIDPPLIAGGDAVTGERCTQRTVSGASDSSFVSYDLRSDVSIDRSSRFALLRPWDDDASALRCAACRVAFSFRRRKHHCRACGKVLCKACTDNAVALPHLQYFEPVRVCDRCYDDFMDESIVAHSGSSFSLDASAELFLDD